MINTSWGGTRIEPWPTPEGFASVNDAAVQKIGTEAVAQRKAQEEAAAKAKTEGKPATMSSFRAKRLRTRFPCVSVGANWPSRTS